VHPSGQAWFLGSGDPPGEDGFRGDDFERLSLEAAGDDAAWCADVAAFWDAHVPLFQSVHDGYQYFALVLDGPARGSVVHGREPEFEATAHVAPSLDAFCDALLAAARSAAPPPPFDLALPRTDV
jgi:hypothetical protein